MNRRQFIETVALGVVAAPVLAADTYKPMPTRPFGKTGMTVSILGFGSGSRVLKYQKEEDAFAEINR